MDKIEQLPDEIVEIYRYGQKQGFIAGVAACFVIRYLFNRRQRYIDALAEARRDKIR